VGAEEVHPSEVERLIQELDNGLLKEVKSVA